MKRKKLIRLTAHSQTLGLLKGQIGFLSNHMDIILVAKDSGNLQQFAESEGVLYRNVEMKREISPFYDLKSLYNLIKLFHKEKPDIVHVNTPKGALLGLLAAKLVGVKHRIYNVNGLRFETATGNLRRILIFIEKLSCACATKVIPQSNGIVNMLKKEHITKKSLEVLHNGSGNGVDVLFFDPNNKAIRAQASKIRTDRDECVFVFVGRLVGDKGINELVEAFNKLSREVHNTRLLLVGGREHNLDPISEKTSELIEKNERIEEYGNQNDVRPFLAASDVFILPSYREGFPNVVLEALSMGIPCIVTNVNGATDAIQDNINGKIIPKRDSASLYEAMKELALNSRKRTEMARHTRPMVTALFNNRDIWKATLQMYNNLG